LARALGLLKLRALMKQGFLVKHIRCAIVHRDSAHLQGPEQLFGNVSLSDGVFKGKKKFVGLDRTLEEGVLLLRNVVSVPTLSVLVQPFRAEYTKHLGNYILPSASGATIGYGRHGKVRAIPMPQYVILVGGISDEIPRRNHKVGRVDSAVKVDPHLKIDRRLDGRGRPREFDLPPEQNPIHRRTVSAAHRSAAAAAARPARRNAATSRILGRPTKTAASTVLFRTQLLGAQSTLRLRKNLHRGVKGQGGGSLSLGFGAPIK